MFTLSVPIWEIIVRGIAVYAFLFAMLRLTGKRQVGQLGPFDLILLLILSNAVQNAMNAGDNSLVGGLISATTLIFINWAVAYALYRSPAAERVVEGDPLVLVRDGQVMQATLTDENITAAELDTALRLAGSFSLASVKLAMLEPNGQVSVWTRQGPDADDAKAA